jgi:hypothetical protein
MNDLDLSELLAVVLGLLIRFGIPLLLTVLAAWGLRRLDQHWQRESEHVRRAPLALGAASAEVRWGRPPVPRRLRLPRLCPAERPVLASLPRPPVIFHRLPCCEVS